jgi:hypothetical protein
MTDDSPERGEGRTSRWRRLVDVAKKVVPPAWKVVESLSIVSTAVACGWDVIKSVFLP